MRNGSNSVGMMAYSFLVIFANKGHLDAAELALLERLALEDGRVDEREREVFVHRNIANVVVHLGLNCLSVIQYAVEVLRAGFIVVCGHCGCGGIKAALEERQHGLIDNWLRHIKDVLRFNAERLAGLDDPHCRVDALCELNVVEQVTNACTTTIVRNAWDRGTKPTVQGWIDDIRDGVLRDLVAGASFGVELGRMSAGAPD